MEVIKFTVIGVFLGCATSLELTSYISDQGLHGTISFKKIGNEVKITTQLNATLEYSNQVWSWSVVQFPVDYTELENRCENSKLGKSLVNLDDIYGYLVLPDNGTSEFVTSNIKIHGDSGIYGKSLLLVDVETRKTICTTITMVDKTQEKMAVARFHSPISGDVYFRWFSTKDNHSDMLITTDLYHVANKENNSKSLEYTEHIWKVYVTDILNAEKDRFGCNFLQLVYDPDNAGAGKALGDIDARLGKVKISTDYVQNRYKTLFRDEQLILLPSDLSGPQRSLYLVIFERKHEDSFLACAKIRYERPTTAKVIIQSGGIQGAITLMQHSKYEPTFLNFNLTTARGDLETRLVYSSSVAGYKIHELPIKPSKTVGQNQNFCLTTKFVYNPLKRDPNSVPPSGLGTQNQYLVGDLSGKLLNRNGETMLIDGGQELNGLYWDTFLPLQGKHSIIHRSLVIYKNTQYPKSEVFPEPWICGSVNLYEPNFLYQKQILTAQVIFRYPTVGRMIMRQVRDEPWSDTTLMIEYLVHADGAVLNNSANHRWAIHDNPPGKDFYSWKERCLSAGSVYNPYKIDFNNNNSNTNPCGIESVGLCRVGDLSRLGTIEISGKIVDSDKISRKLWTDSFFPLSGHHSVLGKSLVLYDDFGPKARGERLACSVIEAVHRRKAVAKEWFSNGDPLTVKGKIEFFQQTEYDITNVEVNLQGLVDTSGYHIHVTPVEENLEFPCEASSLYDHWNPLNVDPVSSPRNYHGTPDQYEMGDLSGKFGFLDNYTLYKNDYNDTTLALFGPRSIVRRSIIIHKKNKSRWVCATIENGYSPSEARELRGIASFHHPGGYAYGYIKMRQLIYNDGSRSDTTVEVKLRHPGKNDRNVTREHNWAIYVNPVGVDASVKTQNTRCVAGGYIWNPYFTQLADPLNGELYRQECGPENPLRCHVGDLSARLGTIDIGLQRKVFVDSNFPLEGDITAIGRSIVILSPNKRPERYACANIESDYDIIKYTNIEKTPRFVVAQFLEDTLEILGIPDWFLTIDTRKTKSLHNNACIQLLLHFKGPLANRLEQDFSRLLAVGRLDAPTLYIPGYINTKRKSKFSYKQCGVEDPNEKKNKKRTGFLFGSGGTSTTKFTKSLILIVLSYLLL